MHSGKKFAYKKKTKFRNLVKIFRIGNIIFDKINSRSTRICINLTPFLKNIQNAFEFK